MWDASPHTKQPMKDRKNFLISYTVTHTACNIGPFCDQMCRGSNSAVDTSWVSYYSIQTLSTWTLMPEPAGWGSGPTRSCSTSDANHWFQDAWAVWDGVWHFQALSRKSIVQHLSCVQPPGDSFLFIMDASVWRPGWSKHWPLLINLTFTFSSRTRGWRLGFKCPTVWLGLVFAHNLSWS